MKKISLKFLSILLVISTSFNICYSQTDTSGIEPDTIIINEQKDNKESSISPENEKLIAIIATGCAVAGSIVYLIVKSLNNDDIQNESPIPDPPSPPGE